MGTASLDRDHDACIDGMMALVRRPTIATFCRSRCNGRGCLMLLMRCIGDSKVVRGAPLCGLGVVCRARFAFSNLRRERPRSVQELPRSRRVLIAHPVRALRVILRIARPKV